MKDTRIQTPLLVGNLNSSISPYIPPSCLLSRSSQQTRRAPSRPADTVLLHTRWKSTAPARSLWMKASGQRRGVCFHPLVRKETWVWKGAMEMGFNHSCWRQACVLGGGCSGEGAVAARHSYGRNVPSGTRCSFLRSQRHCAVQEPARKAHTAPLLPASSGKDPVCLAPHKQTAAPLSGRQGKKKRRVKNACSQLLPTADDELKRGQGDAHFSWWYGERPVVSQKPSLT